jgi:hypothetical protein
MAHLGPVITLPSTPQTIYFCFPVIVRRLDLYQAIPQPIGPTGGNSNRIAANLRGNSNATELWQEIQMQQFSSQEHLVYCRTPRPLSIQGKSLIKPMQILENIFVA